MYLSGQYSFFFLLNCIKAKNKILTNSQQIKNFMTHDLDRGVTKTIQFSGI